MDAAGPRGREAAAEPARPFRIGAGGEGGGLLVAHLDEADLVLALAQRLHDPVDAIAWQTEDDVDAPLMDGIDQDLGSVRSHPRLRVRG
jgi:hypothetical protein